MTAFEEFSDNLDFAQRLIPASEGPSAAPIRDVADLHRAAWLQAVTGLDRWITREIVDRAVALALDPSLPRPRRYLRLDIPMELFEQVHRNGANLGETLTAHWRERFGRVVHQRPDAVADGLAHVMDGDLWLRVAEQMTSAGAPTTPDQVRERLRGVVDHAPRTTAETAVAIAWLREMGAAILAVLGGPVKTVVPAGRQRFRWEEHDLLAALTHAPADLRESLLAVYRHAEAHPAFRGFSFGSAAHPSVTASFQVGKSEVKVWSISTGPDRSVLAVNVEWMREVGPARLDPLLRDLSELPGAQPLLAGVAAAGYRKRPSLTPEMIAGRSDVVTRALDALLSAEPAGPARMGKPFWRSALERRLYRLAVDEGYELMEATDEVLFLYGEDRKRVLCLDRDQAFAGTVIVALPPTADRSALDADPGLSIDPGGRNANFDAFLGGMAPQGFLIITCRGQDAFRSLLTKV
ncbi:hypothetical protein [Herbidospora sp. RD11066]